MVMWLNWLAVIAGIASAACWYRAGTVKVDYDTAVAKRVRKAEKLGLTPSRAGVILDGNDLSGTFEAQSAWNSRGALLAAASIALQTLAGPLARAISS